MSLFGQSLSRVNKVTFGSRAASFTIVNDGLITAIVPDDLAQAPACPAGTTNPVETVIETVDITVTTQTGCTATLSQGFTYQRLCVVPTPVPPGP